MKATGLFLGLIIGCVLFYGIYWIGKTVSYEIFYADMVELSIEEKVKSECLK